MTRVIFVRHGETAWNHSKRYQGHSDVPLNETGRQQAESVAQRLAGEPLAAVYCSDLIRAVQTANSIARPHLLQPIALPELREINFGAWEGLTYEEIMAGWPDLLPAVYSRPDLATIPAGESFSALQRRAAAGLASCIAAHAEETIAVVAHGGTLQALLCEALGLELGKIWRLRQDRAAINIVEYFDSNCVVSLLNDTCHLNRTIQ